MVTEVQSKMYLQGYYSMKDLSNGAGYGGWSLPHESNSLKSGQHFGMYLPAPLVNGMDYDVYEKEKLRQTIMKHESIFRQQVHELHRLYKKQRDLMNEIRGKEQPSRFSFGFHYEDDKRSCCASSFPVVGPAYGGRPSSSSVVVDVNQSPQSSVEPAAPSGPGPRDYEPSDLKFKKPQRRLFDLEVPADEYVDDESEAEVEFTESREVTRTGDKIDVNALRSNSSQPKRTHNLADLNEPIEADEVSASASDNNRGNEVFFPNEHRQSLVGSTHVYSNVWCTAKLLSENRLFGKNGDINSLQLKNEIREKECPPFSFQAVQIKDKNSFSGILQVDEFRKPGDSSRAEASKVQVKRRIFGVEVAEGNNDASSFAPRAINLDDSDPSSTSSWTKPETGLNPNAAQYGLRSPNSAKTLTETACRENGVSSFLEPRKAETPQAVLPWLRASHQRAGPTVQDSSSTTRGHDADRRRVETSDCSSVKTILGFPIFDAAPKNDESLPKPSEQLDAGDPRKGPAKESRLVRIQIDLNECVAEEESPPFASARPTTGIDLEAPVALETDSDEEEEQQQQQQQRLETRLDSSSEPLGFESFTAAEALVAIAASGPRRLLEESLHLLADAIPEEEGEEEEEEEGSILEDENYEEADEFERIVLNLPEAEVEEFRYFPAAGEGRKEAEERPPAAAAGRRAKRGQARRGRQRVKDFQSEVLPGMVTLSRNEVTEDLQTIEGLVRAIGGTWQPTLAVRTGGVRGRRRSGGVSAASPVVVLPPEVGAAAAVEESKEAAAVGETSLTGWGKRTRRPPRQRCPISNSLLPLK